MTPAIEVVKKAGVPHDVHQYPHDPHAESYGQEAAAALRLDPGQVFKTLIVEVDGEKLVVAVLPVAGQLQLKSLASSVDGKRAKLADRARAERSTGYVLGGISPLGQRRRLPTVLDRSALDFDRIYVSAGRRGLEISLSPNDLIRLLDATTASISA